MLHNKTPLELRAEWLATHYTTEELAMIIAKLEELGIMTLDTSERE